MIEDKTLKGFLDFLEEKLINKFSIIVLGGNALVLLGLKQFTKDVDICLLKPEPEIEKLRDHYKEKEQVEIDIFYGGIFKTIHLKDYLERISKISTEYKKVDLYIIDILDVILNKIDRMIPRDFNDCYDAVKNLKLKKSDLDERFQYYLANYIGSKSDKDRFIENYNMFTRVVSSFLA